jgi:predicted phosphoribosyltransferase
MAAKTRAAIRVGQQVAELFGVPLDGFVVSMCTHRPIISSFVANPPVV